MKSLFTVLISLLTALCLEIFPLPSWAEWIKPEWALLTLIYWSLTLPNKIGITVAFIIGILMDLLTNTLLGQHAFIFALIIYFMLKHVLIIRNFPLWQQSIMIFVLVFVHQTYQFWVWGLLGGPSQEWFYWLPCLTSALFWPWASSVLSHYQQPLKIRNSFLD